MYVSLFSNHLRLCPNVHFWFGLFCRKYKGLIQKKLLKHNQLASILIPGQLAFVTVSCSLVSCPAFPQPLFVSGLFMVYCFSWVLSSLPSTSAFCLVLSPPVPSKQLGLRHTLGVSMVPNMFGVPVLYSSGFLTSVRSHEFVRSSEHFILFFVIMYFPTSCLKSSRRKKGGVRGKKASLKSLI